MKIKEMLNEADGVDDFKKDFDNNPDKKKKSSSEKEGEAARKEKTSELLSMFDKFLGKGNIKNIDKSVMQRFLKKQGFDSSDDLFGDLGDGESISKSQAREIIQKSVQNTDFESDYEKQDRGMFGQKKKTIGGVPKKVLDAVKGLNSDQKYALGRALIQTGKQHGKRKKDTVD